MGEPPPGPLWPQHTAHTEPWRPGFWKWSGLAWLQKHSGVPTFRKCETTGLVPSPQEKANRNEKTQGLAPRVGWSCGPCASGFR